jgi:hypothetical protein
MRDLTLTNGTYFIIDLERGRFFGQIQSYQEDPDNPGLYWFDCNYIFDFNAQSKIDTRTKLSSRNFEQAHRLQLVDEEEAQRMIRNINHIDSEDEQEEPEEPEESEEPEEPRERLRPITIENEHRSYRSVGVEELPDIPVESGDMKTLIKLYKADPIKTWQKINEIVSKTGHLLFTYLDQSLREKLINQKIEFTKGFRKITLSYNNMYSLKTEEEETKAIYLGDNHWAMLPNKENNIPALSGYSFIKTRTSFLENYSIVEIHDSALKAEIRDKTISAINREYLDELQFADHITLYTKRRESMEKVSANELGKNWEKALVYNYFIGGEINRDIDLTTFEEKQTLAQLAKIRNDQYVIDQVAA